MRYYLSSLIDKATRDYIRDTYRNLSKFRQTLDQVELEELHFHYKYLGKDLLPLTITQIEQRLRELVTSLPLTEFYYDLSKVQLGSKLEYHPSTIRIELVRSDELNDLYRLLHNSIVQLELSDVIARKDHNTLLGVIKIAEIRTNLKTRERKKLNDLIDSLKSPPQILINNLCIIAKDVYRNKQKQRLIATIPLAKLGVEPEANHVA